tara:strand:+ start:446 stop:619 length:174 start_codon:yes stop_codon:yes gene_type:complete
MTKDIDKIKNELLKYLLNDVEDNFCHLTIKERDIIGDQETLDMLIASIFLEPDKPGS